MADRTTSSIRVRARPADVMAVIADFAAYPQWASGVRSAEVTEPGEPGRARQVRFQLDAGMFRDSYVLRYRWDGDRGVRWDLAEPGSVISELTGEYRLSDADGVTEVTYELSVDIRIPMLGVLKRKAEKTIIDTALRGLRERIEAGPADSGGAGGGDGT